MEQSLAPSREVDQEYAIVTFDLAAYALVWQYSDQFSKVIVRMGVFNTIYPLFGTLGKMTKGSGLTEIIIESDICASGSLDRVMTGKHSNRALKVHKLVFEALERLLLMRFEEDHPRNEGVRTHSLCLQISLKTLVKKRSARSARLKTLKNSEVTLSSTVPLSQKH